MKKSKKHSEENDLSTMPKWQFWQQALMSGNKKGKLKTFSDAAKEKLHLYKRMTSNKATASEIMRLSFLTGATSKEEYDDYLDIEKRYGEESDYNMDV